MNQKKTPASNISVYKFEGYNKRTPFKNDNCYWKLIEYHNVPKDRKRKMFQSLIPHQIGLHVGASSNAQNQQFGSPLRNH